MCRSIDIHSNSYYLCLPDPMEARFEVSLFPNETCPCLTEGISFCCHATFIPLTEQSIIRLLREVKNQDQNVSSWGDIENILLGEVVETIIIQEENKNKIIQVKRLLPMIIKDCARETLYNIYIRTVPSVVDLLEKRGIILLRAKSILNSRNRKPVCDHSTKI